MGNMAVTVTAGSNEFWDTQPMSNASSQWLDGESQQHSFMDRQPDQPWGNSMNQSALPLPDPRLPDSEGYNMYQGRPSTTQAGYETYCEDQGSSQVYHGYGIPTAFPQPSASGEFRDLRPEAERFGALADPCLPNLGGFNMFQGVPSTTQAEYEDYEEDLGSSQVHHEYTIPEAFPNPSASFFSQDFGPEKLGGVPISHLPDSRESNVLQGSHSATRAGYKTYGDDQGNSQHLGYAIPTAFPHLPASRGCQDFGPEMLGGVPSSPLVDSEESNVLQGGLYANHAGYENYGEDQGSSQAHLPLLIPVTITHVPRSRFPSLEPRQQRGADPSSFIVESVTAVLLKLSAQKEQWERHNGNIEDEGFPCCNTRFHTELELRYAT